MKKNELVEVRDRICTLAKEGREIHKKIGTAKGLDRYRLWADKRVVGEDARAALLAYAYLRGVPYRVVEPESRVLDRYGTTDPQWLWGTVIGATTRCILVVRGEAEISTPVTRKETMAEVKAWMKVPEVSERKARRVATRTAWFTRKAELRHHYAQARGAA